jgi:hypothetical protein
MRRLVSSRKRDEETGGRDGDTWRGKKTKRNGKEMTSYIPHLLGDFHNGIRFPEEVKDKSKLHNLSWY